MADLLGFHRSHEFVSQTSTDKSDRILLAAKLQRFAVRLVFLCFYGNQTTNAMLCGCDQCYYSGDYLEMIDCQASTLPVGY